MDTQFITQRSATEFHCTDVEALTDWLVARGWQRQPVEHMGELERLEYDGALIIVTVAAVKVGGSSWELAGDVLSELARPVDEPEARCLARAYMRLATFAAQRKAPASQESEAA